MKSAVATSVSTPPTSTLILKSSFVHLPLSVTFSHHRGAIAWVFVLRRGSKRRNISLPFSLLCGLFTAPSSLLFTASSLCCTGLLKNSHVYIDRGDQSQSFNSPMCPTGSSDSCNRQTTVKTFGVLLKFHFTLP